MTKLNLVGEDLAIYNCHIHTFTRKNVPKYITRLQLGWLGTIVGELERNKFLFNLVTKFISFVLPGKNDVMVRLRRFAETGDLDSQEAVFRKLQIQYPRGTKFIVLPMNLDYMGDLGKVQEHLDKQLIGLLDLASTVNKEGKKKKYGDIIYPFYTIHPKQDKDEIKQIIKQMKAGKIFGKNKYKGLKIYPNLGYKPTHELLMEEIYPICQDEGVPIMTHCTPFGIWSENMKDVKKRREFGQPKNYEAILKKFPKLKICLAHFGGAEEWIKHIRSESPHEGDERAWVRWITDMIKEYDNLYTDISYTVFTPDIKDSKVDLIDYLKVMLTHPKISSRVLFGSDYYMIEQEKLTEKEVSFLLRSRIGEEFYKQIAHINPKRFLGKWK